MGQEHGGLHPQDLGCGSWTAEDSPIELRLDGATIAIEPCVHLPRLGGLLEDIRPDNVHREVDTGPAAGDVASWTMAAFPERGDVVWILATPPRGP